MNGANVSQWNDKSGNGRNVSQSNASSQPTYLTNVLNGKSVLDYGSNINSKWISGNFSGNLGRWYGVADWDGGPTFNDFNALTVFNQTSSVDLIQGQAGSNSLFGTETLFLNGSSIASSSVLGVMQNPFIFVSNSQPNPSRTQYRIGGDGNINRGWRGYIAEVIFTSTVLNTTERQLIEGYLAWKWGLTDKLPSNHPYKWDGTLFGGINITDTDARNYIAAIETVDGRSLENGVRTAIQNFIVGTKADGIWDAIKSSAILSGARTLNGALVPLKGTAPTNFNFVAGDYNRETGLIGNATTKYLNNNRNNNTDPQDSKHISSYVTTEASQTAVASSIGFFNPAGGSSFIGRSGSSFQVGCNSGGISSGSSAGTGFQGVSRSSASSYFYKLPGNQSGSFNISSQTPANGNILVFLSTAGTASNARLSFYSIGEALDLALLDTRVTQLMTDLGNAIP